jgi:hypothetical protein
MGLIGLVFVVVSCEKWIDPDININPNQPEDVPMELLLPFIEANVAYRVCGSMEFIGPQIIWLQQLDGTDRQQLSVSNYVLNPTLVYVPWDNSYAEILMDAKVLKEKAIAANSPHNLAISNIMTVITLGQLTDAWNDIPWSEALKGNEETQPVFDTQEYVYLVMDDLLDEAIDSLSVADPVGVKGDYFYDGSPEMWLRATYALKARYALHLSKRRGPAAYQEAMVAVALAFTGSDDDLQFQYGTGETESNPLYQFMRDRDNVRMGSFLVDMMNDAEDPRLPVYSAPDANGEYVGSTPGQTNVAASRPGVAFAAPDAPTYLITYVEMLFTKAEALYMTGAPLEEVREVLGEAVAASLEKFGVMDGDWMNAYRDRVVQVTGEELLEEIMTQKYIATFYQPEAYHSWRRTGYPVIPPNPVGQMDEIPRRFPYPATEMVWNPNTPTGISITDRVWWDAE